MKFTTKIKDYREKVGMKQSELAELVNVRREQQCAQKMENTILLFFRK